MPVNIELTVDLFCIGKSFYMHASISIHIAFPDAFLIVP